MDLNMYQILNSGDHSLASYPKEILESIFKNLPAKDLINCLAVCHSFNDTIATSDKFMSKINFTFNFTDKTQLLMLNQIVQNTNRKYANMADVKEVFDHFLNLDRTPDYSKSFRISQLMMNK